MVKRSYPSAEIQSAYSIVKYSLADNMRQGKKILIVQPQTDAPEESDLWTAWQLFPFDDNQTLYIELLYNSVKTGSQWVGDQMS